MNQGRINNIGPLVTVLIPTYNRRQFLPLAVESVIRQSYTNFEVFVMNDGGEYVGDIIESFNDSRINYIDGKENRGKPARLNEALAKAQGKYVCYIDDDDLFYPHHISTLVDVLENKTDCQVAYSDLYKAYCRVNSDGARTILSKIVEVSRDFDPFFMFYFNHTLHVSLMHRRDLLDKTGPYNENLNVLIDWDLTKRLVFFSDFYHIHDITGEFYSPIDKSDRISVKRRRDPNEYARNVMAIRTSRPPKPWPKVDDVSIIFTADRFDQEAGNTLGLIWRHTFYPYEVYLPMPSQQFASLNTQMPNLINVPVAPGGSQAQQVDACLSTVQGEYVTIVPSDYSIGEMWMEDSLYALMNKSVHKSGLELESSTNECWGAVIKKDALVQARRQFPNLTVPESLRLAGIIVDKIGPGDIPFQFDELYNQAKREEEDGNWNLASEIYEHIIKNHANEIWVKGLAARSLFETGNYQKAFQYSQEVNEQRPTVDTLVTEARVHRKQKNFDRAINLYDKAREILEGRQLQWMS